MPPQPEYVLIRDKALKLIYLAQKEFNNNKYELVCFLTYIAKILLKYSLDKRQGSITSHNTQVNINDVISMISLKNDLESAKKCLDETLNLVKTLNKVFMEKREEECNCWGE